MRVAQVTRKDVPCLLLQRVASVRTFDSLVTEYLGAMLSSAMFVAHFLPETTGVSVPHISPEQISRFVIPIPPVEEQRAICAYLQSVLDSFDALTTEAFGAVDLLQERRAALISAAVTGKIDVRHLAEAEAA